MAALQAPVRMATCADVAPLSGLLADAFREDPFHGWIFPDARARERRHRRFFALSLQRRIGHETVLTTSGLEGVAAWSAPGWSGPGVLETARLKLLFAFVIGVRAPFLLPGVRRVVARQPRFPHWYLSILATAPDQQGKGVGTALMTPILGRCDAEGVPAYLEATSESAVSFYERFGFAVVDEVRLPGGPFLWPMLREG